HARIIVLPGMKQRLTETSMALQGAPDRRQLHEIRACTDDVQNVHEFTGRLLVASRHEWPWVQHIPRSSLRAGSMRRLILTIFFCPLLTFVAPLFRRFTDRRGMQTNEYLHAPLESS